MTNPTDSSSDQASSEGDQNDLSHSDQDSPGIAAKKARLRAKQAMSKIKKGETKMKANQDLQAPPGKPSFPGALQAPFQTGPVPGAAPYPTNIPVPALSGATQQPDMTRVAPNGQTGGSLGTNAIGTVQLLKKFLSLVKPGTAGAEEPDSMPPNAVGRATMLPPMQVSSPDEGGLADQRVKQALRTNPEALRRFRARLSAEKGK